jgi:hypothetical protein
MTNNLDQVFLLAWLLHIENALMMTARSPNVLGSSRALLKIFLVYQYFPSDRNLVLKVYIGLY